MGVGTGKRRHRLRGFCGTSFSQVPRRSDEPRVCPRGFPEDFRACAFLLDILFFFVTGSKVTVTWSSRAATTIVWMRTSRGETTTWTWRG